MVFQFLRDTGFSPQEAPFWFIFLFAGIAGFCAFQARKLARRNAVLRKSLEETRVSLAEKSVRADAASENEAALSEERKRRESLEAEIAATAAQMAERERMFADQQNRLQTEFKALSNDLLQGAHKSFLQRADETFQRYRDNAASESEKRRKAIDDMLKPVSETLHRYEKGLADMRAQQEKARGELHGQIGALAQSTHHVRAEAQKLANALRAGPKTRGRWGEEQLRNVVEIAGMQAHVDFVEQESHTDGERRKQPDMVVRLPGDRVVAVDSKVSLSAYLDAIDAETDELRIQRMRQHAEDLWSHVKALSAKDYAASLRDSLDYVIMFVPGENYYAAALDVRPQLYQDAFDKKILIATPTILIAMLKSAALNWRQEKMTQHAREVAAMAKDLYDSLKTMSGHMNKVGKSLEGAVKSYNAAVGGFEGRVLSRARKFADYELPGVENDLPALAPMEQAPRRLRDDGDREAKISNENAA